MPSNVSVFSLWKNLSMWKLAARKLTTGIGWPILYPRGQRTRRIWHHDSSHGCGTAWACYHNLVVQNADEWIDSWLKIVASIKKEFMESLDQNKRLRVLRDFKMAILMFCTRQFTAFAVAWIFQVWPMSITTIFHRIPESYVHHQYQSYRSLAQ